jgi:hypothetical protein
VTGPTGPISTVPGPAGSGAPVAGILFKRTGAGTGNNSSQNRWERMSDFGGTSSTLNGNVPDSNGRPALSVFPLYLPPTGKAITATIFANNPAITFLTGAMTSWIQTSPFLYSAPGASDISGNNGWYFSHNSQVSQGAINPFSTAPALMSLRDVNEFSTKLTTGGTPIGDMYVWLYFY